MALQSVTSAYQKTAGLKILGKKLERTLQIITIKLQYNDTINAHQIT